MLQWSITFLVLAIVAGLFGFGGVAAISIDFARITFFVFLILSVLAAVGALRVRPPQA